MTASFAISLKEAIRGLYAFRQRTLLALLGIAIGIAAVISMVSISRIAQEKALSDFKELGTEILSINQDYDMDAEQRPGTIHLSDALALPKYTRTVASVAPFLHEGWNITYGGHNDYVNILGVTQSYARLNKLNWNNGRFISDLDVYRNYCVIGADIVERLQILGMEEVLGAKLHIGERLFTVIGVLDASPSPGILPYQTDESILIPISTASRFFNDTEINTITARMHPNANHVHAAREIRAYFQARDPELRLQIDSAEEIIKQMEKQMQLFTLLTGAIGGISLLMGGVGVMNVMLSSLSERRVEIGIRRALGARRRDIQNQFLLESVILALLGGIIGILLGVAIAWAVAYFNHWYFLVSYSSLLVGAGVASGIGVFFGFYPAYQAARQDPIAALRVG